MDDPDVTLLAILEASAEGDDATADALFDSLPDDPREAAAERLRQQAESEGPESVAELERLQAAGGEEWESLVDDEVLNGAGEDEPTEEPTPPTS